MTDWREDYQKKLVSAEEAAKLVKSGDYIVFTMGREAFAVGLAIAARKEELQDVNLHCVAPGYDFGWYDEGWQDSFKVTIAMITATSQEAVDAKRVDLNPGVLLGTPRGFMGVGTALERQPDVVLTEVSPPDKKGFCSFGQSVWDKKKTINQGKLAIAEVNKNLIRTYGDNYIHVSEIDYFVEHISIGGVPGTGSLAGRVKKEPEPFIINIARYVNKLIKDGATIQIGVGRTTEPLVRLGMLEGKNDIGYHSEATPSGIITLVKEGVITGKRKNINQGKAVVTSLGGGTREEMEWASENPLFWLVDVDYLEDIRVISTHDNYAAINNALAIDLTGQIDAETIGIRPMAGAGGQPSFVIGALLSKGGCSITTLPSTAVGGKVSRITPLLPEGSSVTIPRQFADYVITEYGAVRLWGKSLRQRAQSLISIAHPDFRDELTEEAKKMFG
ncbi:MAG: acetyl-CoA hydrolase/transferase C-terminal domain-containing protein [Chloroflexota bacterium]|nr:acetyl-CoA hydrolase/transferase C-terminal domain-containing protein [Chloroflexota bacterium]